MQSFFGIDWKRLITLNSHTRSKFRAKSQNENAIELHVRKCVSFLTPLESLRIRPIVRGVVTHNLTASFLEHFRALAEGVLVSWYTVYL